MWSPVTVTIRNFRTIMTILKFSRKALSNFKSPHPPPPPRHNNIPSCAFQAYIKVAET